MADGEFISPQRMLGPEVTRANAVSATEDAGCFLGRKRRNLPAMLMRLERFAQRHPNIARQRIVAREAFVGPFEDDHIPLAAEGLDDRRFRERP